MPDHDFSDLLDQYPQLIEQMPETFSSHQFILELARQNQVAYVEALYSYRNHKHRGAPAPFLNVHRILAQYLTRFSGLVVKSRDSVSSTDIFGRQNNASEWRKIS